MGNKEIIAEWVSPSNLAIVKYWGKKEIQKPQNSNISFSLKSSYTKTKITAKSADKEGFDFFLDNEIKTGFNEKIHTVLNHFYNEFPLLKKYHLKIESENSFPHSSGIASSARGMSALAFCLADLVSQITNNHIDISKISEIARIGSGSAARSVYAGWTIWGKHSDVPKSSDNYAVELTDIHSDFKNIGNAILIVSPDVKKVSSSAGHKLMNAHPYADARIKQANENVSKLLKILKNGDWDGFFELAENEALSLHALMMSSLPGYFLMLPNSLKIIEEIQRARKEMNLPVGFSMDAGPNVHLLYNKKAEENILPWIDEKIRHLCDNQTIIFDEIGDGPQKIND